MVSDSELSTGEVVQPEGAQVVPLAKNKRGAFWLLLVAAVLVGGCVWYCWKPIKGFRGWRLFRAGGIVTGIMYNPERPAAVVCGQIVHEGEEVGGYRIIKIHEDQVELEKLEEEGGRFTERVYKLSGE
jgi:hypothetical protein